MATPKRRVSHARTHNRKAHWLGELKAPEYTVCKHCGEPVQNYCVCPACGFYKGRQVIKIASEAAEEEE
ncbi:MAG: 50S ribosomal protein L32 [Synergistes sp.]|nr:50S ribosomal protein L32 [Synergistes sp.]